MDFPRIELTAVNTAHASENRIHDDETARRYGFRGGLVPGVGVYGYLARPFVATLGPDWLKGSKVSVRFRQPVYEGSRYVVSVAEGEGGWASTISAEDGTVCGVCTVALSAAVSPPGTQPAWVAHPAPDVGKRPISLGALKAGTALTAVHNPISATDVHEYASRTADQHPAYQGERPLVHAFTMLQQANDALASNYALGPWIHTASEIENYAPAFAPADLLTYSEVVDAYERKGHEYAVLDTITTCDGVAVQRARHTAIFKVAERA